MKKKMIACGLVLLLILGAVTPALGATENLIIRVGFPQGGENQNVGTVRIIESEDTIDSIQLGDVFTIFVNNAEFMGPPTLVERGRFNLSVLTGGQNGDSYITYQFVDPGDPARTGRVIIDFVLDNMRVSGDVSARVESVQSGVTNGFFRLPGTDPVQTPEPEKLEARVLVTGQQIREALDKGVNILINGEGYQILLPNEILKEASIQGILQNQQSLEVEVVREKSADSRYLGRLFRLSFSVIGLEGQRVSGITGFSVPLVLRISGEKILDPANVRGITLETPRGRLLASHYEANSGMIHLLLPEVTRQIGLVRAFNRNERIFTEETGLVRQGGQAYLPLRIVATEFGWDVVWNPFTRMVNLTKGDKTLVVDEFIIVRERSFVTASFLAKQLEIPVFVFDREVVLKKY